MTTAAFASINWSEVARQLGGVVTRAELNAVHIYLDRRRLIVSDNVGEVNVSEVVDALPASVPLPPEHYEMRSEAVASRLHAALHGREIDHAFGARWDEPPGHRSEGT